MPEKMQQEKGLVREIIQWVGTQLNWFDLITFFLGALILFALALLLVKKRKKMQEEELTALAVRYEESLGEIKEGHLHEVYLAEERVREFKEKLELVEAEYEKEVGRLERKYHKKEQEALSHSDLTIFSLKKEMARIRQRQIDQVDHFDKEIQRFKGEIESLHQSHAQEIEASEMEISDLRKQMYALINKV